ncbi:MAG: adenosylhomocysteinase [Clostridia bacterium]|nr:adenosylhomocysteinase [Clostridia bacterium]
MNEASKIRCPELAPQGEKKIAWAREHMPVLKGIFQDFSRQKPLAGKRITMCLHLEAKTAFLAETVQAGGAEVTVTASNPLSTQDDVVAALVQKGIRAFAWRGATPEEYFQHLRLAVAQGPHLVVDDGADLVALLHKERADLLPQVIGGSEETTTGVARLRVMEREGILKFPMVAVNDARCKFLFDNRYGTGQSVWDGIMRSTNLIVAGKTAVVIGYGWCGRGVALRARGLGARVIVCEVDPIRANEALMDGQAVMPLIEAAPLGDFFITVTGNTNVIRREHLERMRDGAILANAGHFDVEISKPDLEKIAVSIQEVRAGVQEYRLADGRRLYLLGEGRLVNLANGDGHPTEIMDLSFALQALTLAYLAQRGRELKPGLYPVPADIDIAVARRRLEALKVQIDALTPEQEAYLHTWQ